MAEAYAQGNNTYVANTASTGNLVVSYSRNPNSWAVVKYAGLKTVDKAVGLYTKIDPSEGTRLVDGEDAWVPGSAAREGDILVKHEFIQYNCRPYSQEFILDEMAIDQGSFDVRQQYETTAARKAMLRRTYLAAGVLTTTGNYTGSWGTHTDTATSAVGGKFDAATSATKPYFFHGLQYAANKISQATGNAIGYADLQVTANWATWTAILGSYEVRNFFSGSYDARTYMIGDPTFLPSDPGQVYGFPRVVENSIRTTTKKGAASISRSPVFPDGYVLVSARVDKVGTESTFNTATIFAYKEMLVEYDAEPYNHRIRGHVLDRIDCKMTAPETAFLFTSATG